MIVAVVAGAGVAGYIFYKYRLRVCRNMYHGITIFMSNCLFTNNDANTKHFSMQSYMDSEIMAIMSQYMPLDNQHNNEVPTEAQPLRHGTSV